MHIRSKFDGGKQVNRSQSGSWESDNSLQSRLEYSRYDNTGADPGFSERGV